jgi:hypothetical protein
MVIERERGTCSDNIKGWFLQQRAPMKGQRGCGASALHCSFGVCTQALLAWYLQLKRAVKGHCGDNFTTTAGHGHFDASDTEGCLRLVVCVCERMKQSWDLSPQFAHKF